MKTADVLAALRRDYGLSGGDLAVEEWALLTEVRTSVVSIRQSSYGPVRQRNERSLDVLLVRNWGGGIGHRRIALEVKVSRADYKRETDAKRAPAEALAHQCAYAAPAGLIAVEDLPAGWGLLEIHPAPLREPDVDIRSRNWGRQCAWRKTAPLREPTADFDAALATVARRASRAEERIRRGEGAGAEVAALTEQVRRLEARQENAERRVADADLRRKEAERYLATMQPQVCADCREPLKPTFSRRTTAQGRWLHVDPAQEPVCLTARETAEMARLDAEGFVPHSFGRRHLWLPVQPLSEREADDEDRLREAEILARTEGRLPA